MHATEAPTGPCEKSKGVAGIFPKKPGWRGDARAPLIAFPDSIDRSSKTAALRSLRRPANGPADLGSERRASGVSDRASDHITIERQKRKARDA